MEGKKDNNACDRWTYGKLEEWIEDRKMDKQMKGWTAKWTG